MQLGVNVPNFGPGTHPDSLARWAKTGKWEAIFKALQIEVDETGSLMDATIVRAHQHSAGARKKGATATRR